jgi:DNA-directed RNA polymerase subunit L
LEIRIEKVERRRVRLIIKGEDYTPGNLIQEALLADDRIEGAGYYIAHPLLQEMVFEVRFKEDVDDPFAIILEDVERLKEEIKGLRENLAKKFKG